MPTSNKIPASPASGNMQGCQLPVRARSARPSSTDLANAQGHQLLVGARSARPSGNNDTPTRPKVSIIVPAYNAEPYLDECLDSLESQTLDSLQIILIDDGSADATHAMMERRAAAKPQLYTVLHQENSGQAVARNLGLAHCTGEYVGFLDSDDYADAEMFQQMYAKAKASDVDLVTCGIVGFCDDPASGRSFDVDQQLPKAERTVQDLYRTPQVQPCIHIVKRSLLTERNVKFPELRAYEDICFHLMTISQVERVEQVQRPYVKRRWRKGSTVSTITKQQVLQAVVSIEHAIDYYRACVPSSERHALLELAALRLLLCSTLGRAYLIPDPEGRAETVEEIVAFVEKRFPWRANNPYLSGLLGMYLKHAGKRTLAVSGPVFAERRRKAAHL